MNALSETGRGSAQCAVSDPAHVGIAGWLTLCRAVHYRVLILGICFLCSGSPKEVFSTEFEKAPLKENQAQAAWLRQKAKETQERYRVRVQIPRGALQGPASEQLGAARVLAVDAPSAFWKPVDLRSQDLILGALICLLVLLAVIKLAPETAEAILARLVPWPVGSWQCATERADPPAEERVFAEFLVAFKAGPPVRPTNTIAAHPHSEYNSNQSEDPKPAPPSDPLGPFFAKAPQHLVAMRTLLHNVNREEAAASQKQILVELRDQLEKFRDNAAFPGLLPVWQVVTALGGLVGQLASRNGAITPHTLRTVASAIDLLTDLCRPGLDPRLSSHPPIRLLAVDDDLLSRHAVAFSLKKAYNQPDLAANGEAALAQASGIAYDVIFLDIQMPHMDGFELCSKIRQTQLNHDTPVVFVTCQTDLDAQAKSNLCGGNDFIAKPFLTFEITVKALVLALRGRLKKATLTPAAAPVIA